MIFDFKIECYVRYFINNIKDNADVVKVNKIAKDVERHINGIPKIYLIVFYFILFLINFLSLLIKFKKIDNLSKEEMSIFLKKISSLMHFKKVLILIKTLSLIFHYESE